MAKTLAAVIGSSDAGIQACESARQFGELIARNGWVLITGGRDAGVMKAANEGAKKVEGSLTIGILPDGNTDVCPAVDVPITTDMGEARNNVIVRSVDVVIAVEVGDPGTASEVALAIKAEKLVILFRASPAAQTFFCSISNDRVHLADTVTAVIDLARQLVPTPS
jgi:uncharacterized protein (TIGR00725 family)